MKYFVDPNIKKAETLPTSFYTSDEVFEWMRDELFVKTWQWVGDDSKLLQTSSVLPLNLLEGFISEPIVITNDGEKLNCMSNVCTHRGNIVVHDPGKAKKLTCLYHGRRFKNDGSFEYMPEFGEAENFPRTCEGLKQFSVSSWLGHLFVSLEPAFDFSEVLQVIEKYVGFLPISEFKYSEPLSKDYLVNSHWALYCDNYLEGFHIPFVHPDLNAALDYGSYKTEIYEYCNVQIGYSDEGEDVFELPEGHQDYGKNVAAYYFWVFPNMMFNFYPWGLSINIVRPLTKEKCKVSFLTYVWDESKLEQGAGALLDKVEREDEFVVEGVQKGIKSRYYNSGRFSPTREQGVHHFHQLLAKFKG